MDGISIREFARRDNCSDRLVRKAIDAGYLRKLPDGKLDPAAVGTAWRKGNWGADQGADSGADPAPVRTRGSADVRSERGADAPADAGDPAVVVGLERQGHGGALKRSRREETAVAGDDEDSDPETWTEAVANRRKATAMARLRELEYDKKVGLVVPVDEVLVQVGKAFASVRSRILAIAAEQAVRLHQLKTPAEVQDALHTLLSQALEALTQDDHLGAGGA